MVRLSIEWIGPSIARNSLMCKRISLRALLAIVAVTLSLSYASLARADDWPRWQGPDRNAVSRETGLLKDWPKEGPPLVWRADGIGKGMGGIAVSKGRIFTTGDDNDFTAWLYALNESDGKPLWKAKIGRGGNPGNMIKPSGPRSTPWSRKRKL